MSAPSTQIEARERPILFSGPMVRAILEGRKTQTRRVMKKQPRSSRFSYLMFANGPAKARLIAPEYLSSEVDDVACPYGSIGDRLWVRETWQPIWATDEMPPDGLNSPQGWAISYPATDSLKEYHDERRGEITTRCKPSIFMPRWASRITLEITNIRVERLQEISEVDAVAEGLLPQRGDGTGAGPGFKWNGIGYHGAGFTKRGEPTFHIPSDNGGCNCNAGGPTPAQCAFQEGWNSINGKRKGCAWSDNPWCWVIEFKKL